MEILLLAVQSRREIALGAKLPQGLLENVMECLRGNAEAWVTPQAALRTWKLMEMSLEITPDKAPSKGGQQALLHF